MNWKSTTLLLMLFATAFISEAQPTAFTTCPNTNIAIVRSGGGGAATNPFSIYNIDPLTGAASLLSGPIKDPADSTINLQVNGLGLNEVDGYLYGLFSDAPATLSTAPTTPYYRLGANAVAVQLGTLMGPPFPPGDNGSFVIPNAGEFGPTGNYYFSAVTGFVNINFFNLPASTFTPSTFYIGSLTGSNTMSAGTGALSPMYTAITNPGNDATAYLTASSGTITATNAQGLGLQDLVYNTADNHLYTYVTYPNSTNTAYFGQMLRVDPSTGILSAVAPPAIQSFVTASVFPNGMLIDPNGNFLVLLTNGDIYQAVGTPTAYTGALSLLNTAPGLPASLTGDLASCGLVAIALPFDPFDFDVSKNGYYADVNFSNILEDNIQFYEIEYANSELNFEVVGKVLAEGKEAYTFKHLNYFEDPINYYRIKITDLDGNVTYSFVRSIQVNAEDVKVFPNPISTKLTINFPANWSGQKASISLLNQLGQIVLSQEVASVGFQEIINLDQNEIPQGVYVLRIDSKEQATIIKKIQVVN